MTQEEKQLLLKDLCARLPYGVKGTVPVTITLNSYDMDGFHDDINRDTNVELITINIDGDIEVMAIEEGISETVFYQQQAEPWCVEEFTPYLRPMSSMTFDERSYCLKRGSLGYNEYDKLFDVYTHGLKYTMEVLDFLNAHHFDYRCLIEKGLALEAPEGMYKED